jgi:hypothetical protein
MIAGGALDRLKTGKVERFPHARKLICKGDVRGMSDLEVVRHAKYDGLADA